MKTRGIAPNPTYFYLLPRVFAPIPYGSTAIPGVFIEKSYAMAMPTGGDGPLPWVAGTAIFKNNVFNRGFHRKTVRSASLSMKNISTLIYILPILIISVLTASRTKLPEDEPDWMKFRWVGDSLGGQYFDKTRIYLPVNIEGIPHDFTFQFDLGLNVTLVYESSLRPYLPSYPMVEQKLDTTAEYDYLRQVDITIDGHPFRDKSILLADDDRNVLTVDSVNSPTVKHIGSIGADLFQGKVLIIDYPNTRIAVADTERKRTTSF